MRSLTSNKSIAYLSTFLIICLFLTSCYSDKKETKKSNPPKKANPETLASISQAHNTFGFELFKALDTNTTDKNVVISPTSIALALSIVYNGADGETKAEMKKALALDNIDIDDLNKGTKELLSKLENKDKYIELGIANSLWIQSGLSVNQSFIDTANNYYDAQVEQVNFRSLKTKDTINSWVKEHTDNKIPSIVEETQGLALLIANATYFKGEWTEQFKKELTTDDEFTNYDNSKSIMPMMNKHAEFLYKENDSFQAIKLSYGKKKRISMYIFLPKDLNDFVNTMDADSWSELTKDFKKQEVALTIPRFTTQYQTDLTDSLKSLGMQQAFNPEKANFDGIAKDIAISKTHHKTFLEVNEKGTQAAASTDIGMSVTSVPEFIEMKVNKPFFFAIADSQTNSILFTGSIRKL